MSIAEQALSDYEPEAPLRGLGATIYADRHPTYKQPPLPRFIVN